MAVAEKARSDWIPIRELAKQNWTTVGALRLRLWRAKKDGITLRRTKGKIYLPDWQAYQKRLLEKTA